MEIVLSFFNIIIKLVKSKNVLEKISIFPTHFLDILFMNGEVDAP